MQTNESVFLNAKLCEGVFKAKNVVKQQQAGFYQIFHTKRNDI